MGQKVSCFFQYNNINRQINYLASANKQATAKLIITVSLIYIFIYSYNIIKKLAS